MVDSGRVCGRRWASCRCGLWAVGGGRWTAMDDRGRWAVDDRGRWTVDSYGRPWAVDGGRLWTTVGGGRLWTTVGGGRWTTVGDSAARSAVTGARSTVHCPPGKNGLMARRGMRSHRTRHLNEPVRAARVARSAGRSAARPAGVVWAPVQLDRPATSVQTIKRAAFGPAFWRCCGFTSSITRNGRSRAAIGGDRVTGFNRTIGGGEPIDRLRVFG